jgi:hypothetical protein
MFRVMEGLVTGPGREYVHRHTAPQQVGDVGVSQPVEGDVGQLGGYHLPTERHGGGGRHALSRRTSRRHPSSAGRHHIGRPSKDGGGNDDRVYAELETKGAPTGLLEDIRQQFDQTRAKFLQKIVAKYGGGRKLQ